MAKIADAVFTGKSGTTYNFQVYPFGQAFNAVGAVYIFTTRTVDALNKGTHTFAYIGQTGDLSERFDNHHKAVQIKAQNPNCICILVDNNEESRRAIETDMIAGNKTPCNG
jgi:predicted GIY-YIG superfamily endonuclease